VLQEIKEQFAQEIAKPNQEADLSYLALLMAQYITQPFNPAPYLEMLDQMAEPLKPKIPTAATPQARIDLLNSQLFDSCGLAGNEQDYYSPDNSFLNRVLETGQGIPITLSVVYIEVGQRLGLPLWGVGIPRHFVVGYGDPQAQPLYIDPFNRGEILNELDCLALSQVSLAHLSSYRKNFLKPVPARSILFRMLANLKYIFIGHKNWDDAYKALDLMLTIYPDQLNELKERGLVSYRLGNLHRAAFDLKRYLFLAPNQDDTDWVERQVEQIEEKLLRLN
jgi:regulator of sirC expression with transglutaminase-like and TPR domain